MKLVLGMEVGLSPGDFVLDGDPALTPKGVEPPSPIFGPFLLWPNGWMHQDATWYGCRPQPRALCVRWGPSSSLPKGAQPPIFGSSLLCPKGWMHQDATWYGGRPQPRRLCYMGTQPPTPKGAEPHPIFCLSLLWPNGCYGGMGLGLRDIVFDVDPSLPSP